MINGQLITAALRNCFIQIARTFLFTKKFYLAETTQLACIATSQSGGTLADIAR
jgi:hypothetical protein